MYGSSVNGIANQLNIEKSEAERILKIYFKTYPGLRKFIDQSYDLAKWNKMVVTPFGQRKMEYGAHDIFKPTAAYNAALRNSSNVRVQSTTSTLGLITFAHLNNAVKKFGAKSICTVYDSCEESCKIKVAEPVVEEVFHYMDDFPTTYFDFLELPIGCEVEIGINWGNLEKVNRGITQKEIESIISRMRQQSVK